MTTKPARSRTTPGRPTGYWQSQLLSGVFSSTGLGTLGRFTLRQALEFGGGSTIVHKKQNLLRVGVASLLPAR